MTKSLMISIQPQHAFNILYRKKTLELRTWIPKDYVGWVYVYVTKGKFVNGLRRKQDIVVNNNLDLLNGKVAFRFWFDEYDDIDYQQTVLSKYGYGTLDYQVNIRVMDTVEYILNDDILDKLCLTNDEVENYGKGKDLYAWHIKKLEVFDEPKELSDFYKGNRYPNGEIITPNVCEFSPFDYDNDLETCLDSFRLTKPPQRSVWVYTKENDK